MFDPYPQIEIKFLLSEVGIERVLVELENHERSVRTVTFFDTAGLDLFAGRFGPQHGEMKAILRTRTRQGKSKRRATLKLRSTRRLPENFRADTDRAKREFDHAFGGMLYDSYSLDAEPEASIIEAALRIPPDDWPDAFRRLWDNPQAEYLQYALGSDFDWTQMRPFGPVHDVHVWEDVTLAGLDQLTVEYWILPPVGQKGQVSLLEVSRRVNLENAITETGRMNESLTFGGFALSSRSGTKTQLVLEHFL
jgi:hypothetical protein